MSKKVIKKESSSGKVLHLYCPICKKNAKLSLKAQSGVIVYGSYRCAKCDSLMEIK